MSSIAKVVEQLKEIMKGSMGLEEKLKKSRQAEDALNIEKICLDSKHATIVNVPARRIAVHPCNRGGSMVEGIDVQDLLGFINTEWCNVKKISMPGPFGRQKEMRANSNNMPT